MYLFYANQDNFQSTRLDIFNALRGLPVIHRDRWQRLDVSNSLVHATHEIIGAIFQYEVPSSVVYLQTSLKPDLPWSEEHFQERVSGIPMNPGESHLSWPYHGASVQLHLKNKKYDHNYMERMSASRIPGFKGYRFEVGDLESVINLLIREPSTRQAFLPIWFPEDTGVTADQRVPCTIGYHFLLDDDQKLHCQYYIRSCDLYRHFTNDVYLASRLMQYIVERMNSEPDEKPFVRVGNLQMVIHSLHLFQGDVPRCYKGFTS